MFFTILSARSSKNMNLLLQLEQSGNKYIVNLVDIVNHKTLYRKEMNTFNLAENTYYKLAEQYSMNLQKEVDTTEAYEYIDSQYY